MLDNKCLGEILNRPNLAIPWYLMAGYAYYCRDKPILTDAFYDYLESYINTNWFSLEHVHKHVIPFGFGDKMLSMLVNKDYPSIVKGAADLLIITEVLYEIGSMGN